MRKAQQLQRFRTDGQTVSPERLVILLYERLGRDLAEAATAIDQDETERRHNALVHAQQIVEELSYAVRPDVWEGGDGLIALYDFILELLVQANIAVDRTPVDQAAKLISDLTDAWRDAYVSLASTPNAQTS